MYDELYKAWLKEKENTELQKLPRDFYVKLADYVSRTRQEGRMLDRKSAKARLISQELSNLKRLIRELATLRFKKLVSQAESGKLMERGALTREEEGMLLEVRPSFEKFQSFLKGSLRGKILNIKEETEPSKKRLLRFLQEVPAIIGVDLKSYGPFLVEDVATLPVENAKVLLENGVAMEIET